MTEPVTLRMVLAGYSLRIRIVMLVVAVAVVVGGAALALSIFSAVWSSNAQHDADNALDRVKAIPSAAPTGSVTPTHAPVICGGLPSMCTRLGGVESGLASAAACCAANTAAVGEALACCASNSEDIDEALACCDANTEAINDILDGPNYPFTIDDMISMSPQMQYTYTPDEPEQVRHMSPGGHGERTFMATRSRGSFFTENGTIYLVTTAHGIVDEVYQAEQWRHITQFRTAGAEVLSFVDRSLYALTANYTDALSRMSDTWGWSYVTPFNASAMYPDLTEHAALIRYVGEKSSRWINHFGIVGTNRDHFITQISADGKEITAMRTIINSKVADQVRAWSDQKTYVVTELHCTQVAMSDNLYHGKIIEFSNGKIGRVLTVEPWPAAPSDATQRLVRIDTDDIFAGNELASRHAFVVAGVIRHAYAYLTHELPGDLQVVDLNPLIGSSSSQAVLLNSYYNEITPVGTDLPVFPANNTWYFDGAHNLYVDQVGGHLYVCGNRKHGGVLVFDLRANPRNLTLKAVIRPPVSTYASRSYSHDFVVQWYTRQEQIDLLGIPSNVANELLGVGFGSDESEYDLFNVTFLSEPVSQFPSNGADTSAIGLIPQVINMTSAGKLLDARQLREGGGYYHQAWFSSDKRFVFISDEGQPQGRAFDARLPVFKIVWHRGSLRMMEQQPLRSPYPVNVHNIYAHDNRRVRPQWIGGCAEPQRTDHRRHISQAQELTTVPEGLRASGGFIDDDSCLYEPNAYLAAQPFEDIITASLYAAGMQAFRVRHRAGYDLSSTEEFGRPFEWELIGEVAATKSFQGRFGGEWSNYAFGGFETPAADKLIGANGRDSYRVVRLVPFLTGNNQFRSSSVDSLIPEFHLLASTATPVAGSTAAPHLGYYNGAQPEDQDGIQNIDLVPPTFLKTLFYRDIHGNWRSSLITLSSMDALHDVAMWIVTLTSPANPPFAPSIAPIGSDISQLFAYAGDRITEVRDARVQSDYLRMQHQFNLRVRPGDSVQSTGVWSTRLSEIVTGGHVPVKQGDSGAPLLDGQGRLVGILRDKQDMTAGYIDLRNFRHSTPGAFPTIKARYDGFWGTWNARDAGIAEDPDLKVYVLAVNERTGRLHSCMSASASPYHFSTVLAAGDTIQVETGQPQFLAAPFGFVDLKLATFGGSVFSTAVTNLQAVHLLGTAAGGFRCGGCLLPVTGNVPALLKYEILSGTFAGGGPKIVYLGSNGTRVIGGIQYWMIYFELIAQGPDVPGEPQYGGLFTQSPTYPTRPQIHPPTGGNVLTSDETRISLTVAPSYVQTNVNCPEWATKRGFPSRWTKPNSPVSMIGWWPVRHPPTTSTAFGDRPIGNVVNASLYDLSDWRWSGASGAPKSKTSGILGLKMDDDVDKTAYVIGSVESIEAQYAAANRFSRGAIVAIASEDNSVVYNVDSDNYFGVLARFPVGSTVRVQFVNYQTGAVGWRPRKVLQGFEGNQLGLL